MTTTENLADRCTHLVRLWIDNDEPLYRQRREIVRTAGSWPEVADALKAWVVSLCPDLSGIPGDILRTALAYVDWDTMAKDYLEEEGEA